MFELLIWLIIIGAIIASKAKKANQNSQGQTNRNTTYNQSQANRSATHKQSQAQANGNVTYNQTQKKNFAVMPEHKKVPPNVERNCAAEDRHRSENNIYHRRPSQQTAVPNVKRDYTEAPKQTRVEKQSTRMVAKRLYEGDHVPQGYRMVKCGYCAAENLIAHSARSKYMCYFCHEDL